MNDWNFIVAILSSKIQKFLLKLIFCELFLFKSTALRLLITILNMNCYINEFSI